MVTITYEDDDGNSQTVQKWVDSPTTLGTFTDPAFVVGGKATSVSFDNYYTRETTGALLIQKVSETDTSMLLKGAVFTLTDSAGTATTLTTDADGMKAVSDSSGLVHMLAEVSSSGAEYRLIEYEAPSGYSLPAGQWKLTYDSDSQSLVPVGSEGLPPAFENVGGKTLTVDGTTYSYTYAITNYQPADMPISGSIGALVFTLGGVFIMAGGAVWIVRRRKQ